MLRSEILFQISRINEGRCKAYFSTERSPIIGHFVKLDDFDHLISKGLIRFVSDRNEDSFSVNRSSEHTRLYMISQFTIIKSVQ